MKIRMSFLLCTLVAAVSSAQPWQWEEYQGDYYNPSGFPNTLTINNTASVGDFDGDGRSDFFCVTTRGFVVAVRDTQQFHWISSTGTHLFENARGSFARDLDNDHIDELIIFADTIHAWKATSTTPWTWQQRDDLLTGLMCPSQTIKGVYGDFDSDGLLDGIFWDQRTQEANIERYERNAGGNWVFQMEYNQAGWPVRSLFSGDFDHDGDIDFAVSGKVTDTPGFSMIGETTPQGIVPHYPEVNLVFCGPVGGDLDGDGEWEGLFDCGWNGPGFQMVDVEPDPNPNIFVHVTETYTLGSAPAPMFGTFHTAQGPRIATVHSWTFGDPFPVMDAFECVAITDSGWAPFDNGFQNRMDYRFVRGNMADLDDDGLRDIFAELYSNDFHSSGPNWGIWRNIGTPTIDTFSIVGQSVGYFRDHFLHNSDTVFSSPQIGDITGDGRAELGLLAGVDTLSARVVFYEMVGAIQDTAFEIRPDLSNGLTMSFNKFRMADIDRDGLAEVIGYNEIWHAFFFRNGRWQESAINFPAGEVNELTFADANNDGTNDLFADTQVWYNLNPSSTKVTPRFQPQSSVLLAYPNPFNPITSLAFRLSGTSRVELTIVDLQGRKVTDLFHADYSEGLHTIPWDASQLPSGVYFARLAVHNQQLVQKLLVIK